MTQQETPRGGGEVRGSPKAKGALAALVPSFPPLGNPLVSDQWDAWLWLCFSSSFNKGSN